MGVWSTAGTAQPAAEGFSMDYTQVKLRTEYENNRLSLNLIVSKNSVGLLDNQL